MDPVKREERQQRINKERKQNFINSVKPNYELNFIDVPDEQDRYMYLKMYFHTEKQVQPPSHTFSYIQFRSMYKDLGEVFWIPEDMKIRKLELSLQSNK